MTPELGIPQAIEIDPEALVRALDEGDDTLPEEALRNCQRNRELVIPHLIRAIDEANTYVRGGGSLAKRSPWLAYYLLWEFQAKAALPTILAAVPGDAGYEIFGDATTEDLPRVLATLAADNLQVIDEYILNREHDPYSRSSAANSYQNLVRDGVISRAEAVERLASHLRAQFDLRHDEFAGWLVCTLGDLNPHEALEDIREAFAKGVISSSIVRLDHIERALAGGDEEFQRCQSSLEPTHLEDTVEYLRDFACFQPEPPVEIDYLPPFSPPNNDGLPGVADYEADDWEEGSTSRESTTIRNEAPRIGRNDPCPCGSGKKYKKCCMRESPL